MSVSVIERELGCGCEFVDASVKASESLDVHAMCMCMRLCVRVCVCLCVCV